MELQQLVSLIIISLNVLCDFADSTFFDHTCEALSANNDLLNDLKAETALIKSAVINIAKATQNAINVGFANLQYENACKVSLIKTDVDRLEAKLGQAQPAQCGGDPEYLLQQFQSILGAQLGPHIEWTEQTKQVLISQSQEILQRLDLHRKYYSNLQLRMRAYKEEVLQAIQKGSKPVAADEECERKLQELQNKTHETQCVLNETLPQDCRGVQTRGSTASGVYSIQPDPAQEPFEVYCDLSKPDGGWILVLNRFDGSQDFNKRWKEYKSGFGDLNGEFWLGLEHLHHITGSRPVELLVELVDWSGHTGTAYYSSFSVGSSKEKYPLKTLSGFQGSGVEDHFTKLVGLKFSTTDKDHGKRTKKPCPGTLRSGWWFDETCVTVHLTGVYTKGPNLGKARGIQWRDFPQKGATENLKEVRMLIRPYAE